MLKVKTLFTKNYLLLLYNTLFHPHLIYCISAWSSTFSTYPNPLQTLQNKPIKLIEGSSHCQAIPQHLKGHSGQNVFGGFSFKKF